MKESVTRFDLESAFKALDEIEIPKTEQGIRANRPALTEIFSRKSKFDSLFEEYYDVGSNEELGEAQEAREAEVAQAKLARIEKIVDLDAESPEDLLTSYVGKYIMQCPQCMTLFYKDKEDIVESEDDPETVNVSEVCQHCGNESGYTLVGKVGEAEAEEAPAEESTEGEDLDLEIPVDEEQTEETSEEDFDLGDDLEELDLNIEDDENVEEEEKTEESFVAHTGEALVEDIQDDAELDAKLKAHTDYIEYLRTTIDQEEKALEKEENDQIKDAIQRRLDSLKADLDTALPEAVKADVIDTDEVVEEVPEETDGVVEEPVESSVDEPSEESVEEPALEETSEEDPVVESLTEELHEETNLEVSAGEFEKLINSPEFKQPISDKAAKAMLNAMKEKEAPVEESVDAEEMPLEEGIGDWLKNLFSKKLKTRKDIADFILNNAMLDYDKAVIDTKKGTITTDPANRAFNYFIIIGYKDTDNDGKAIETAPEPTAKNLVVGMKHVEVKKTYADASAIAEGWSQGEGPAFIYMAKDEKGEGGVFLCQYFKGTVDAKTDKLNAYKEKVLGKIEGRKKMAKGGADQSDFKKLSANDLKAGMKIKLEDGTFAEIAKVEASKLGNNMRKIEVKLASGEVEALTVGTDTALDILRTSITTESLESVIANLEDLHEASLEKLISDTLVEAYGNIANYKLTDCEYANEKLNINGTIYFTSGNTRKTTYTFSEAFAVQDGRMGFKGLNEKLGLDKQFKLVGKIDKANKTFIAESFDYNK